MIQLCPMCKPHEQDYMHGLNKRVMNATKDPTKCRCTICKTLVTVQKTVNEPVRKEKK